MSTDVQKRDSHSTASFSYVSTENLCSDPNLSPIVGCSAYVLIMGLLFLSISVVFGLLIVASAMIVMFFAMLGESADKNIHKKNKDELRKKTEEFLINLADQIIPGRDDNSSSVESKFMGLFDVQARSILVTNSQYDGIILSWKEGNQVLSNVYRNSEILDCEILEDGVVVANASSAIGGAAIGGVLFGGVGAVVGAVASGNTQREQVEEVSIKINVKDYDYPCWIIGLKTGKSIDKRTEGYKQVIRVARQWHGRIVALKSTDTDNSPRIERLGHQPEVDASMLPHIDQKTPARTQLIAEGESIRKAYEELEPDSSNYHITRAVLKDKYEEIRRRLDS